MTKKLPVVDVAAILGTLSSLYRNKAEALVRENIQNSVDARAKNIWIRLSPKLRAVSFRDDGVGVPLSAMNEGAYFGLIWSTKRERAKADVTVIGSKGIGRLTNIAVADRVRVSTNDGVRGGTYTWFADGSHEESTPSPLDRRGLELTLVNVDSAVMRDLPSKIESVATGVFDERLRQGTNLWGDGVRVEPKQYLGRRTTFLLPQRGVLELYWTAEGQPPADRGIALLCRGVRVGERIRLGIESDEWHNVAGVLHLDDFPLTANREAFEESEVYRAVLDAAAKKVRTYMAVREGGRRRTLNRMAEEYTKAAREALRKLGIELSLLGHGAGLAEEQAGQTPLPSGPAQTSHARELAPRREPRHGNTGEAPGFRLIPKDFRSDEELSPYVTEMSYRRGPEIFVNLGHPACPANKFARSFYIWALCFSEILRWGSLGVSEELPRDKLLAVYRGWLQGWRPDLAGFTPSGPE